MCAMISQKNRAGIVSSDMGPEAFALLRFDGTEHVDGLYTYTVDLICQSPDVILDDLVGTHLTVQLKSEATEDQFFDGMVTTARWMGNTEGKAVCRVTLEPWFALLRHRRNQRIFHEKSVVKILEELFATYGAMGQPAYKFDLTKSYRELEYTVQYRESDLHFALYLMERFGISYYFVHEDKSHTMVLTDAVTQFPKIPGTGRDYFDTANAHRAKGEHFWQWYTENNMTTGAIRLTDFNFKFPDKSMEVDRTGSATYENGKIESYDYPGDYLQESVGKNDVVPLRVDQERGRDNRHRADGDVVSMRAGLRVQLTGQADYDLFKKDFLCLGATHSYVAGDVVNAGSEGGTYTGSYVLTSVDAPYAPARITPKALVHGIQTAIVVGPAGEEIDCDQYGRVKVRFHWDLEDARSMWCRVSQNWASQGWGGMVIPRIGMEVVVDFLEGDPNKPLITGCVYNGRNSVPYPLPEHKTRSTFKTDTHKGNGFNELRFEDKKDHEEIFLHAQKDRNSKVENNQGERVNVNKMESVGNNKAVEVGNNMFQVVDGDMELRVGPGNTGTYSPSGVSKNPEGLGRSPEQLGKKGSGKVGTGNYAVSVEKSKSQTIGENHNETVDKDKNTKVKKNYELDVGKKITINAGDEISLVCGNATINMKSNGTITVNGKKIMQTGQDLIQIKANTVKIN